jgi:cell volume regulation protein A
MDLFQKALLISSTLLILSVWGSKASSRFGIPSLLFFLGIGLIAGKHGLGIVNFQKVELTQYVGVFALIFILFSGGIDTKLESVKRVLLPTLPLATFGVLITSILVGFFAHWVMGFSFLEGLLLGATVASTDVAAVFGTLRARNVSLRGDITPLLELESALNDPMAVFLGVALLSLFSNSHPSPLSLVSSFFTQMIFGALIGAGSGKALTFIINRIKLEHDGLYPVLTTAWIILTYAATQAIDGSGFLAVYVAAIVLGNENLLHKNSLGHFHEGMAWLGQIAMFLAMGLLVDLNDLWRIAPLGIGLSFFLVFVARPLSIFLCFPGRRFKFREKLMISWAGLRGAVPIILASYVLASHIPLAKTLFDFVFFVTFFSVLLQGTTIPLVAKWLNLNAPHKEKFRFPLELNPTTQDLRSKLIEVPVPTKAKAVGRSLVELKLPQDVLIVLIERMGDVITPRGGTVLQEKDTLLVLSEGKSASEVAGLLL